MHHVGSSPAILTQPFQSSKTEPPLTLGARALAAKPYSPISTLAQVTTVISRTLLELVRDQLRRRHHARTHRRMIGTSRSVV